MIMPSWGSLHGRSAAFDQEVQFHKMDAPFNQGYALVKIVVISLAVFVGGGEKLDNSDRGPVRFPADLDPSLFYFLKDCGHKVDDLRLECRSCPPSLRFRRRVISLGDGDIGQPLPLDVLR